MQSKTSRRQFIKSSLLGTGAALISPALVSCQKTVKQPNIIFLLTDDQCWDTLGCMGNPYVQTPNMDAPAQVILRWDLQHGVITIPKSVRKERIRENADIFDFELSADDMFRLDNMGRIQRDGPDPDNFDF